VAEIEKSLITDEHRAMIGTKTETRTVVVEEVDARRMRDALGDRHPAYADGTGVAPPYILAAIDPGPLRRNLPRILPGGILTQMEWRLYRPIRIGERLREFQSILDIRDRLGGRYGYSVLVTLETEYLDLEGNPVATTLRSFTQFDPASARSDA
jgi:hypothetical protein